jgi:hypothetical protein
MAAVKIGVGFGAFGEETGIGAEISEHMASI